MSDNMTALLISSTIILFLIIYDVLLIIRLIQAHIYKNRNSYIKVAQILPLRHNTPMRQKRMTEKQITVAAMMAVFVITCAAISLAMGLIKNFFTWV